MDEGLRELLKAAADGHAVSEALESQGMQTIDAQLRKLVVEGETSLDEALRVGLQPAGR